jgi:hypothetical protein
MILNALGRLNDTPTGPKVELTTDETFHLLSNSRRRYIVQILKQEAKLTRRELTDRVIEREHDKPIEEIPSNDRQSVRVSLQQNHLERLADHDVIRINHNEVRIGPNAKKLFSHLDTGWF